MTLLPGIHKENYLLLLSTLVYLTIGLAVGVFYTGHYFRVGTASAALPTTNTVTLTGTATKRYQPVVPDGTLFDARQWTSTAVGGSGGPAVSVNKKIVPGRKNITWRGGVIKGSISPKLGWASTHTWSHNGLIINNGGPVEVEYLRVHNVGDAFITREQPEYSNTGSWYIHDCYMTAIRDDAVETDRFEPGTVENCLFDGVYVFLSEQNENVGTNNPIGLNEDKTIYVKNVYVRLHPGNTVEDNGGGVWFKWQPDGARVHNVVVSDSVFATSKPPRLGWNDLSKNMPKNITWAGSNNFILWLGPVGKYGGPRPAGVTFLEGKAAHDKWISARNSWLTSHGLPAQTLPADYNPLDAPVARIPYGGPTKTPTPTSPLPGDIDGDNDVDIFDYNLLVENFGRTSCGNIADINGDCKVDIFDYNILIENFGKSQ